MSVRRDNDILLLRRTVTIRRGVKIYNTVIIVVVVVVVISVVVYSRRRFGTRVTCVSYMDFEFFSPRPVSPATAAVDLRHSNVVDRRSAGCERHGDFDGVRALRRVNISEWRLAVIHRIPWRRPDTETRRRGSRHRNRTTASVGPPDSRVPARRFVQSARSAHCFRFRY